MTINQHINNKINQWGREAELFCAQHGKNGGRFTIVVWANGQRMAEPEGGRVNQAIPFKTLQTMIRNNWRIFV